jgi:hypothetical protein
MACEIPFGNDKVAVKYLLLNDSLSKRQILSEIHFFTLVQYNYHNLRGSDMSPSPLGLIL